jgi:TctA family transporter
MDCSHGDPLIFLKRPISATLIVVAVFMMISSYYRIKKSMEREKGESS